MWTEIATSVAEGPLKEAGVTLAKVAPTPPGDQDLDKVSPVSGCLFPVTDSHR